MNTSVIKATSNSHDLINAKVASIFILGCSALVCAVLPIALTKYFGRKKASNNEKFKQKMDYVLGLFLRFGGGVLLATTFIHLLPEVREDMENTISSSWPLSELIMCVGFFIMYATEEIAHLMLKNHAHNHTKKHLHDDAHHQHVEPDEPGGHSHIVASTPLRGLLITIALSVHQIFEGMAIGLEDDLAHVWVLLGAVAVHKCVIALCVGAEMASSPTSFLTAALCVSMFAIASPTGIAIGIGLRAGSDQNSPVLNAVSVILQGLATGTLMYVVFFEVLTKLDDSKLGLLYCITTFIGFAIMVCLLLLLDS